MNAGHSGKIAGRLSAALRRALPPLDAEHIRWLVGALLIIACVLSAAMAWRRWGGTLVSQPEYQLTEASLLVTPAPEWIHPSTNVVADVVRDGSLRDLNLLDTQTVIKVADAFKLHTWVKRVVRVSKQAPASVVVELEYRKPVALVEVLYNNVLSYEPVDVEGVVLPEDLFHHDAAQLDNYLRITADYSLPQGPLGTQWGDPRIIGGARLAALLETAWRDWNLYRIVAIDGAEPGGPPLFEIRGRGNSRIVWGHAPGEEVQGEAPALQKIVRLAEHVQRAGPLDAAGQPPLDVDLR